MTPSPPWTPRQRDVVEFLCLGFTHRLIAQALGISESTVNYHVTGAARRLSGDGTPRENILKWAAEQRRTVA